MYYGAIFTEYCNIDCTIPMYRESLFPRITCPPVVSRGLVGLVVSQKHHLQYNPSLLNWMYWSHHANLILIILIFIFIDLVASVKQGDNALGIASSHLSSYADYLADMVDLI